MNITSKYSKINYEENDEILAKELSKYLDNHAEEIYDFFDPTLERNIININIMTKGKYDELHKETYHGEVPKWSVGFYNGKCINYVSLNDYKNTSHKIDDYEEAFSYYLKTIVHEYVHFVTSEYCIKNDLDKPIKYLSEGIAQVLSGQRDNDKISFTYTTDDILNSSNYGAWYMTTKYILDVEGKNKFFELLSNRKEAQNYVIENIDNMKMYYSKKTK